jgi:hypothetical protein
MYKNFTIRCHKVKSIFTFSKLKFPLKTISPNCVLFLNIVVCANYDLLSIIVPQEGALQEGKQKANMKV